LDGRREDQPGTDEGPDAAPDIETTMNVYGKTLTPEMRAANTL